MLEQNQAPGAALSLAGVGSLPIKPETWQLGEPFVTVFPPKQIRRILVPDPVLQLIHGDVPLFRGGVRISLLCS